MAKSKTKLRTLFRVPRVRRALFGVTGGLALASPLLVSSLSPTHAATLNTLNFQARLQTNPGGAIVADGNYNIEFKLYNASGSSGSSQGSCTGDVNCLWTETRVSTDKVRVSHGYLSVSLGSITSFPAINWDQDLWITMNVGGTGSPSWNGEMSPRLKLSAVPYAFRAGQLATNNGSFTSTLTLLPPSGGNQIFQIANHAAGGTYTLLDNLNGIQNTTTLQSANIAIQSANTNASDASLRIKKTSGQTGDYLTLVDDSNNLITSIDQYGNLYNNSRISSNGGMSADAYYGGTNVLSVRQFDTGATSAVAVIQGGPSPTSTADLLRLQDSSTNSLAGFNNSGQLFLGRASGASGSMRLYNSSNANTVTLQSGATSASYTLTLPTALGSTNDCIKDTGSGVLGFAACGGTSGVTGVGTIDSQTKSANGAVISGSNIVLQTADASNVGLVSTGVQTFAGNKTFQGTVLQQGTSNSTSALRVRTASGGTNQNVLNVDTVNEQVTVGAGPATSAKLDVYGASGAPALRVYQPSNSSNMADFSATSQGVGTAGINGTTALSGSGTSYNTSFKVGDSILVSSATPQLRTITAVGGATSMTVNSAFSGTASGLTYFAASAAGAGTVGTSAASGTVSGSSTTFTTTFKVGDSIAIDGEGVRTITAIGSNTSLTISPVATNTTTTRPYARANYDPLTIKPTGALGVNVLSPAAALHVQTTGIAQTTLTAQAANGQLADIFNVTDSNSSTLFSVGAAGGLTVNHAATAGTGFTLNSVNASGTQTNGLFVNHNGAGTVSNGINVTNTTGTTTAGLSINQVGGTLSNGVSFTGTIGTDITRDSGALNVNGQGGINLKVGANPGTTVASLSSTGQALFKNTSNSSTALQIQNSAGANLLSVDTAGNAISLLGNNSAVLSSWTTTTAMSVGATTNRVRGGAVTYNGYIYYVGGNDGTGTALTTVQYAKLNADGTVGTWASTTALPAARQKVQPVVINGYMYIIGGNSGGGVVTTSYYAKLNTDGTVGTWNTTTALTNGAAARELHATVAYNGYVYVIGGYDGIGSAGSNVYYNKANPDGTLGTSWSTTSSLNTARSDVSQSVTVANGYVYIAGGWNGSDLSTVEYAKLNTDGTLGSWTQTGSVLATAGENYNAYSLNGYLYTVGGDASNRTDAFPLNANGSLGGIVNLTAFPLNPAGETGIATANGYVYILGGSSAADGGGTARNTVYYAGGPRVTLGGSLDLVGLSGENLSEGGSGGTLTAGNTTVVGTLQVQDASTFARGVNINGALNVANAASFRNITNSSNAFQVQNSAGASFLNVDTSAGTVSIDSIFQASGITNGAGSIGSWTTGSQPITAARKGQGTVTANGYVYVVGGRNTSNTSQTTVYYAKLNSDGSTGAWTTSSKPLTDARSFAATYVNAGYIYVTGGINAAGTYKGDTMYAKLNADGSTGDWTTSPNVLPSAAVRAFAASGVANGYVYVMGGSAGSGALSTVFYAKLNADGTVGTWTTSANGLPAARAAGTSVIANGFMYYIGGDSVGPTAAQSTIYYSKLNPADGSNAAFSTNSGNPLLAITEGHASVVANGFLYVIGGDDNTTANAYNTVNYAKLNSDGTTGAWTVNTANPLTGRRVDASAFTANGYIYIVGGQDQTGTAQSTVYYASTPRISITANLDLIGANGGSLSDAGGNGNGQGTVGGSIFAGNIYSNGGLQVVGSSQFSDMSILGNATFRPTVDSTAAFQIQDASAGKLLVADTTNGQIVIGQKADTTGTDTTWTRVSQGTPGQISSGGNTGITGVTASTVYNGSLYVGTAKTNGAEVYRYDGNGNWTVINTTPGTFNTTTAIDGVYSMQVFNGQLYIGTGETAKAEVYRYDGGTGAAVFTSITNATAGTIISGVSTAYDQIGAMTVFGGQLYFGANKTDAAGVFAYGGATGGTIFTILPEGTQGSPCGVSGVDAIDSMIAAFGSLYIGTADGTAKAQLCVHDDNEYTFKVVNTTCANVATPGTFCEKWAGGDLTGRDSISTMVVYNGRLTLALSDAGGAVVLQLMSPNNSGDDASTTFERISYLAGQMSVSGGTTAIPTIYSLAVYNGSLFAGTGKSNAAELYRYDSAYGANALWTRVSHSTAGTVSNVAGATGIDFITFLQPFNNKLYSGTFESGTNQGEVYENTVVSSQSYGLTFQASAGNTQQSGFPNQGSISFLGDLGTGGGAGAGINNSGAFLFTNSIITSSGAYDVAEDYATRDTALEPGDVVAADTSEQEFVKRAVKSTDTIVGVYSSKPALRLSQKDTTINGGRAVPIALAGRVPVKVNSKNGTIKPGDFLTMSDVPGVATKATKAGFIIGRSLGFYNDTDASKVGKVMTFMNLSWYDPSVGQIQTQDVQATDIAQGSQNAAQQTGSAATTQSGSASILNASDITTTKLTVTGDATFKGDVTIAGSLSLGQLNLSGHIVTSGEAPKVELADAAGTGSISLAGYDGHLAKVSLKGNDVSGTVTVIIGDQAVAGNLFKVIFHKAYGDTPEIVLTAIGKDSARLQPYIDSSSHNDFQLGVLNQPQIGATYKFAYHVLQ